MAVSRQLSALPHLDSRLRGNDNLEEEAFRRFSLLRISTETTPLFTFRFPAAGDVLLKQGRFRFCFCYFRAYFPVAETSRHFYVQVKRGLVFQNEWCQSCRLGRNEAKWVANDEYTGGERGYGRRGSNSGLNVIHRSFLGRNNWNNGSNPGFPRGIICYAPTASNDGWKKAAVHRAGIIAHPFIGLSSEFCRFWSLLEKIYFGRGGTGEPGGRPNGSPLLLERGSEKREPKTEAFPTRGGPERQWDGGKVGSSHLMPYPTDATMAA